MITATTTSEACVCSGERQMIYEMDGGMSVAVCQGCGSWSVLKPAEVVRPGVMERVLRWLAAPTTADHDSAALRAALDVERERSQRLDRCGAVALAAVLTTAVVVWMVGGGGW